MKLKYIGRIRQTGSVWPSSSLLARAMFDTASQYLDQYEEILFAGVGNGAIAGLFAKIDKRVVFIDIDREFCQRFRPQLGPGQEVVCLDIQDYLGSWPDATTKRLIVSCVPMRGAFRSNTLRDAFLEQVARGSTLVFFSYLPFPPWRRGGLGAAGMGIGVTRRASVFRNIPPAFVYSLGTIP